MADHRTGAPGDSARFELGPTQAELVAINRSSPVFVAAERKAGWCNTALEALACKLRDSLARDVIS